MSLGSGTTAKLLQTAKPGGKLIEADFERRKLVQHFMHNKTCKCDFKLQKVESREP